MGEFILNGRNYGGSIITPNPSDTPTDSLDSIKIDNTTYDIQGGGGSGSNLILDAQIYSLEEQVIGIWTDGKPLYQKTVNFGTLPNATSKSVNHNISSIDYIVSASGIAYNENNSYFPIPFVNDQGNNSQLLLMLSKTVITIRTSVNRSEFTKCYVTIQYTKTTDTAGSGGYQAYGFSPIIYSDIEREIGVWSDNKPLYKKTFFLDLTVTDNAWTHYLLGTTGIDIKDVEGYFSLSSIGNKIPFSYYRSSNEYFTWYTERNNEDIAVRPNINAGASVIVKYVTIIYTKNSDVAGSGEYNTLAIPNVHYSTGEQVIGTWIDGKPLYQKTKVFPNTVAFANGTVLDMEISNADTIFVEEGYFYDVSYNLIGKLPYSQNGNSGATLSVAVNTTNKSQLKVVANTTFSINANRYITATVRYTKTTD